MNTLVYRRLLALWHELNELDEEKPSDSSDDENDALQELGRSIIRVCAPKTVADVAALAQGEEVLRWYGLEALIRQADDADWDLDSFCNELPEHELEGNAFSLIPMTLNGPEFVQWMYDYTSRDDVTEALVKRRKAMEQRIQMMRLSDHASTHRSTGLTLQ